MFIYNSVSVYCILLRVHNAASAPKEIFRMLSQRMKYYLIINMLNKL